MVASLACFWRALNRAMVGFVFFLLSHPSGVSFWIAFEDNKGGATLTKRRALSCMVKRHVLPGMAINAKRVFDHHHGRRVWSSWEGHGGTHSSMARSGDSICCFAQGSGLLEREGTR